jgi:hypothetical protein
MNINNFKRIVPNLMKAGISPMLWGQAGIGKTAIMKQISRELGYNFIYLTLAAVEDNSDLIGLLSPIKDENGQDHAVRHLKPDWFPTAPKNFIFIDEANRLPKSLIQSMLTFILDKKLHTHYLPPDSHIFMAANPPTDDYIVGDISDKALISRLCHITLEPSVEEFLEFCALTGKSDDVISFIQENPEMLETKETGYLPDIHPDRRSWADFVSPFLLTEPPKELVFEIVKGLVGTAGAVKLDTHLKSKQNKVRGKDVLNSYTLVLKRRVRENENNLDMLNIIVEEIVREIKLANKITKKQGKNVVAFLLDTPIEFCYNAARQLLDLGNATINEFIGEDPELVKRIENKLEEITKKGESDEQKND